MTPTNKKEIYRDNDGYVVTANYFGYRMTTPKDEVYILAFCDANTCTTNPIKNKNWGDKVIADILKHGNQQV